MIGNDHQNSISTNSTDKCQSNKKQLKVQIISEKNSVKKAQRKLHFLSNFNLALFPLIFLSDLLLLSFNQLKLLDIEFLHEETKKKKKQENYIAERIKFQCNAMKLDREKRMIREMALPLQQRERSRWLFLQLLGG